MSDSELTEVSQTPAPPDHELERSLRREVVKAVKSEEEYTINTIRAASESKLGLKKGFYKAHEEWASRSKQIINEQLSIQDEAPSSPPPKKRASTQKEPTPRKRQRTTTEVDDSSESDLDARRVSPPSSDFDSETGKPKQRKVPQKSRNTKPKAPASKRAKAAVESESEEDEEDEDEKDTNGAASAAEETKDTADDSESEMSVLLDEEPPPKKKRKEKEATGPKPKKTKTKTAASGTAKGKSNADLDPDQAEIKRLQGWLVKCGIRKLWGKELKPYETPKAKIKHLKEMLAEVGMTGRYSTEKASQIREARELAADIEAVQEGAERWGADDAGDGGRDQKQEEDGRPARRLVRGAKNYDFLSSDGEETD